MQRHMATVLKMGPANHGQPISLDEFMAGDYEEGYQYELIDGELYVVPQPDAPQGVSEYWIARKLDHYAEKHPTIINFVYTKCRVFVPGRRKTTCPEPDVTAYHDFPLDLPLAQIRWQDVSPILVVEVLCADDPEKDLVRNVALYLQVPSIKEYWILDTLADPDHPTMRVHRRHGKKWRIIDVAAGATYTTRLLPGFKLLLDPHR
jgi:Uma2 family endonuclease